MKLAMIVTKITGNEKNGRMRVAEYCYYAAHKVFTDELGAAVECLLVCRLAQQADEIGEEMLICAMYTEELIERLEEMEGF